MYRVNWFRAKARRDRWYEEKILLESELEWTHLFFIRQAEFWYQLSEQCLPARRAYALNQRHIWLQFGCYAERALEPVLKASSDLLL